MKERQAGVAAYLARTWKMLREGPRTLSHKETVALAGDIYKALTATLEDDPGPPERWQKVLEMNRAARQGEYGIASLMIGDEARQAAAMEERFGGFVDASLAAKSLIVDAASRRRLLTEVARALDEAASRLEQNAKGDYRPDEKALRFPEWKESAPKTVSAARETITGLYEGWRREAIAGGRAAQATQESYKATISRFVKFLGHDDASRVAPTDVVRFKDARLAEINPRTGRPISARTVKDSDLVALKSVFGWAAVNHRLPKNPAAGIVVAVAPPVRKRIKGFTDEEALAILRHATNHKRAANESPKMAAAKRWVPWLCAYSGARVGEIVQLRKKDVQQNCRVWLVRITPEAGAVKGRRFRDVPLHPHLVEMGFPKFVQGAPEGHLFFTLGEEGDWRGPWQTTKNRVAEFVREVVPDRQVQPNHGWRHRFITLARMHNMDQEIRRMITGHKGEGVDEDVYGEPAGLYREITKLPRYEVD